ncbi:MAG: hypothetical protein KGL39_07495 [Patescibacteria group bacterium]|nr:hypothetical protein [Patescibacteria group bacterium]
MFDPSDTSGMIGIGGVPLKDMTRPTSVGIKVNVHVIPAVVEPAPDFEAMRQLVAGPAKGPKAPIKDDNTKG